MLVEREETADHFTCLRPRDNTDQGSQSTSAALTGTLAATGVRISMDARGRWMDNVFI